MADSITQSVLEKLYAYIDMGYVQALVICIEQGAPRAVIIERAKECVDYCPKKV